MNTNLSCAQCHDALPGYVAGTLPDAAHLAVATHVAHCADCQGELAQWQRVADLAHRADARVPASSAAAATWAAIQAQLPSASPPVTGATIMDFEQHDNTIDLTATPATAPARHEPPPPRRRTPLFASVAAVLLVALAATIFAVRPHTSTPTPGSGAHPTQVPTLPPAPTSIPQVTDILYYAATIVAANDMWAVGDGSSAGIAHFDGHQWQIVYSGTASTDSLDAISLDAANDGWAVGSTTDSNQNLIPLLVHYTNGQWVRFTLPIQNVGLRQVQMFSANDGWAEGEYTNGQSVFFHYANGTWTKVDFTPSAAKVAALTVPSSTARTWAQPASSIPTNVPNIVQEQMFSDSDGWAIGTYHNANVVWHDVNGHWTTALQLASAPFATMIGLGVNASNDVWVIGTAGLATGLATPRAPTFADNRPLSSGGSPVLLHYNGQAWKTVPIDISGEGPFFGGTWLTSYGTVAQQQVVQGLLHNQSGQWVVTLFPAPVASVISVAEQPDGSTLAVGVQGDNNGPQTLQVLRYLNGTWSVVGA